MLQRSLGCWLWRDRLWQPQVQGVAGSLAALVVGDDGRNDAALCLLQWMGTNKHGSR